LNFSSAPIFFASVLVGATLNKKDISHKKIKKFPKKKVFLSQNKQDTELELCRDNIILMKFMTFLNSETQTTFLKFNRLTDVDS
jgi:hypothetical protein